MALFGIYISSSDLVAVDVKTTAAGRSAVLLQAAGYSSVTLIDNDGTLAERLRQAADQLDAMATPELWAAS